MDLQTWQIIMEECENCYLSLFCKILGGNLVFNTIHQVCDLSHQNDKIASSFRFEGSNFYIEVEDTFWFCDIWKDDSIICAWS